MLPAQAAARPVSPIAISETVLVFSASTSVSPVIVRKTQNPESFIQPPVIDPAPIAITM